ncbi:hypothetical protein EG833_01990 [archaeon]|nr:hypothetical protein [archaeon]
MKIDGRLVLLFTFPLIAVMGCTLITLFSPDPKPFVPGRPQFLSIIDQLGVTRENIHSGAATENIRNVFVHVEPVHEEAEIITERPTAHYSHDPVSVSMVVDNGSKSYGMINGKKMYPGESTESFILKAIHKNLIVIRYHDGIEETVHVKAY